MGITINFHVGGNSLTGQLPTEIGQLTEFSTTFQINSNSFTGQLPTEIGQMTKRTANIDMSYNSVSTRTVHPAEPS